MRKKYGDEFNGGTTNPAASSDRIYILPGGYREVGRNFLGEMWNEFWKSDRIEVGLDCCSGW